MSVGAAGSAPALPTARPVALRGALAVGLAVLLALCVRLPARDLPLEGDAVAYGALARSLAAGDGFTLGGAPHDRYPPAWPALLAVPVAAGSSVTAAVRGTAWLLGGAAAGLLVALGLRLGLRHGLRDRQPAPGLPALVALAGAHPVFSLFVGGLVPGPEALVVVLLLSAWLLRTAKRPAARWLGLAAAGLLPLVRYDALPFSVALAVLGWRDAAGPRVTRTRVLVLVATCLPFALWLVRNVVVLGRVFGSGYEHHTFSLARLPGNLLVAVGLWAPVVTFVVLLPSVVRGLKSLWGGRAHRAVARAALLGAAGHVVFVLLLAGPTGAGDGALRFSSGSLRFALAAWPVVLVAAALGLRAEKPPLRRVLVGLTFALTVPLSLHAVSGGLQGVLPTGPLAAARLRLLADGVDLALRHAGPNDWIGFDLLPRRNEGVEVFLGERAPGRTTGVLVVPRRGPPAGRFPTALALPLDGALPEGGQLLLLTDVPRDGPVFTGDRLDLGVGGRGIFHRTVVAELDRGRAGTLRIDSVVRPGAR